MTTSTLLVHSTTPRYPLGGRTSGIRPPGGVLSPGLGRQARRSAGLALAHGDDPAIALYTKLGIREDVLHFDIPIPQDPIK
ncbi:hypothetical protein GCM10008997_27030 [Halomonas salifodinae]